MSKKLKMELDGKLAKVPDSVAKNAKFKSLGAKLTKALAGKGDFFDDMEKFIKEVTIAKKKAKGSKDDEACIAQVEACLIGGKDKHLKFKVKSNRPK